MPSDLTPKLYAQLLRTAQQHEIPGSGVNVTLAADETILVDSVFGQFTVSYEDISDDHRVSAARLRSCADQLVAGLDWAAEVLIARKRVAAYERERGIERGDAQ